MLPFHYCCSGTFAFPFLAVLFVYNAKLSSARSEQVLLSSSEAAEMILRVDDIVQCAPRKRDGE